MAWLFRTSQLRPAGIAFCPDVRERPASSDAREGHRTDGSSQPSQVQAISTWTPAERIIDENKASQLRRRTRYARSVKLPFNRERMRERNLLDDIDEIRLAAAQTPGQRFIDALDLSDLAIDLYLSNPHAPVIDRVEDLAEKARLWAVPLAASKR